MEIARNYYQEKIPRAKVAAPFYKVGEWRFRLQEAFMDKSANKLHDQK